MILDKLDKSSGVFNNYYKNLHNLLSKTGNLEKPFIWYRGDNGNMDNTIALLKNRIAFSKNGVILRCLNYNRHWNHYYNKPIDICSHLHFQHSHDLDYYKNIQL